MRKRLRKALSLMEETNTHTQDWFRVLELCVPSTIAAQRRDQLIFQWLWRGQNFPASVLQGMAFVLSIER